MAITMCCVASLFAQGSMNAYNYSRTDIKGTARYMGMGGAFGALGGDISTLSQNPAGIGVYRSNEIVTTLGIAGISAETKTSVNVNNNLTKFVFDNVGIIGTFNTGKDLGIVSYNFGFAYNRRNSYDQTYRVQYSNLRSSVTNYIADKSFGIRENDLAGADVQSGDAYDINGLPWLSILGYESLLMSPQENPEGGYYDDSYEGLFGAKATGSGSLYVRERGRTNEYTFNFGGNVSNVVYFGIGLGIMDLDYEMISSHDENLFNTSGFVPKKEKIEEPDKYEIYNYPITASNFSLWNRLKTEGTGFNVKLGLIARVTDYWRLGLAFHTPTYYSLERSYYGDITTQMYNNATEKTEINQDGTPYQDDMGSNSWCFTSPARLLFGISYTFGNFGLITVDYERDWYNGIRVKNTPDGFEPYPEEYKAEFKQAFQGTNTIRAGVEFKPLPTIALRVGAGYTDSMFKNREHYYDSPLTYETRYITAGVGFNLSRYVTLDLAYQNVTDKQTKYRLFYSIENATGDFFTTTGLFDTKSKRHNVAMSLIFRF